MLNKKTQVLECSKYTSHIVNGVRGHDRRLYFRYAKLYLVSILVT